MARWAVLPPGVPRLPPRAFMSTVRDPRRWRHAAANGRVTHLGNMVRLTFDRILSLAKRICLLSHDDANYVHGNGVATDRIMADPGLWQICSTASGQVRHEYRSRCCATTKSRCCEITKSEARFIESKFEAEAEGKR